MLDRPQKVLRLACIIFVVLLIAQLGLLIKRGDPLNRLTIPQVPTLPSSGETNAASAKAPEKQGTNTSKASATKGTNQTTAANSTNSTAGVNAKGTNLAGTNGSLAINQTNAAGGTNVPLAEAAKAGDTNAAANKLSPKGITNLLSATNTAKVGTNLLAEKSAKQGTNSSGKAGTNAVPGKELARKGGPGGRPEPGKAAADLPPLIKARVERITQSEILGQIPRPMPMALLGIADKDVFLRAPDGQTGTIKEGGELGGVKLLKVGINRVLIEHEGQKKELTLFSGLGSETLMPKTTDKTNETTNKTP